MIRKLPSLIPWPWHRSPVKPWPYLRRAAALLALSASLSAAEITVTTPIRMYPYEGPTVSELILIDGFDPALGTLTSVRVDIELHELLKARGENLAPGPATFLWSSTSGLRLSTITGNQQLFQEFFPKRAGSHFLSAFDGAIDFGGTSGYTDELKQVQTVFSAYFTGDPAELQRFVGVGGRPFQVQRLGGHRFAADSGKGQHAISHRVGGRVLVTYVYQ